MAVFKAETCPVVALSVAAEPSAMPVNLNPPIGMLAVAAFVPVRRHKSLVVPRFVSNKLRLVTISVSAPSTVVAAMSAPVS